MCEHDHELSKEFLKNKLDELKVQVHHIYALIMGLPKENCYLRRYFDIKNNRDGLDDEWERENLFSLHEFFERYDELHPQDPFGFYLAVHLERIDADRADQYEPSDQIYKDSDFTVENLEAMFDSFFECYCEKCLRDNKPFELTAETISRFGFTPDDVAALGPMLDRHNAAARKMIRKEYDALSRLDFIRKSTVPE